MSEPTDESLPRGPHELELGMLALRPALEAVLMVADQPLDHLTLAQAVGHPPADVEEALAALVAEYDADERGFELRNAGGGWRYVTRDTFAPAVERFVLDGQQARPTQAALETLAVVAYRQPISRSRISAIRGVNVDGVVRTLVTRGLLEEAGVDLADPASGKALTVWVDGRYGYLMLFTGDPLPDVDRRSLAVEPMTCPPNAFRSGEGLIRLEPGDSVTSSWGIAPRGFVHAS